MLKSLDIAIVVSEGTKWPDGTFLAEQGHSR